MNPQEIIHYLNPIRDFFNSQKTKSIDFRLDNLNRLYLSIKKYEPQLLSALSEDLAKSPFESYNTEISIILHEIKYHIRHLRRWAKPIHQRMPWILFPSKSFIIPEPYGVVLIFGTWNYPFQLLFLPLIAAISSGNCAILKTSPNASATNKIMETIVNETFANDYVTIIHGNRDVNQALLNHRFDYIFFTGNPNVGRVVMEAAARNLTPVTLELGGKSPCIIDKDANLLIAARRIIWGKTLNAGQTCIAPDYLFVHQNVLSPFLKIMNEIVHVMYGDNIQDSPDYPRIISQKAMNRLISYLNDGTLLMGGKYDLNDRFIEPTIIGNLPLNAPALHEEIFGPIFPLMTFNEIDEVVNYVNQNEKPLALYLFSNTKKNVEIILTKTSSGGACVNDTIIHVANPRTPFGGVGNSGLGNYHGKYSFDTFSHLKTIVISSPRCDFKIKYPPYSDKLNKYKKFL